VKKLILLVLIVIAIWQARIHYPELIHRKPSHEAMVVNDSGVGIESVRLIIGDQTFTKDKLDNGQSARFSFRVDRDATFKLVWLNTARSDEKEWSGGQVAPGPLVQRHVITLLGGGGVIYRNEDLSPS